MRAPDEQAEARWKRFKLAIANIGIDADQAVVASAWGGSAALRDEFERIGVLADELKRVNPTAKQIAGRLRRILDELDEIANLHWPRGRLYRTAKQKLADAVDILQPEYDVLSAAGNESPKNAVSAESVFRRHALRVWKEVAGERHNDRALTITFVFAAENAFLAKPKRDAIRKWLARHMADMSR